jgi:two-component system cell cycle sensor histidine kinase/response regulator CckA
MPSPTRILIVEDEPLVAKTLVKKVTGLGYQVTAVASTAVEGLASLREHRPDLSLTDISLDHGMDGIEFARIASEEHGVPVIYVTGLADPSTLQRAKVTDPYGYVTKPFDDHHLKVAIEIALYRHEMQKELARRAEMLRHAAKLQATASLAAGVGHHFNNLLQIMMGYAEVIRDDRHDPTQIERAAETIVRVGRRARDVVRRMMLLSSPANSDPEVIGARGLLGELCEMLRTLAPDDVQIEMDGPEIDVAVRACRADVENIVVNLGTNALEAMRKGGRLRVSAREVTRAVSGAGPLNLVDLTFRDSGTGITEDVRARLFEPFFTTKDPAEGLGLGLVTALALAQRNGGFVEIEPQAGGGTVAHLLLPAVPAPGAEATPQIEEPFEYPVARRGETVLVVEDDPDVRTLLIHDLRQLGYILLDAEDGAKALELVKAYPLGIHLLVTDIVMPGMSGTELADELARMVPGLKILLITGDEPSAQEASGRHSVLIKPFSRSALAVRLRAVLDAARA